MEYFIYATEIKLPIGTLYHLCASCGGIQLISVVRSFHTSPFAIVVQGGMVHRKRALFHTCSRACTNLPPVSSSLWISYISMHLVHVQASNAHIYATLEQHTNARPETMQQQQHNGRMQAGTPGPSMSCSLRSARATARPDDAAAHCLQHHAVQLLIASPPPPRRCSLPTSSYVSSTTPSPQHHRCGRNTAGMRALLHT
jgi:hypothetical protein